VKDENLKVKAVERKASSLPPRVQTLAGAYHGLR